jgi:hypothetical protein
LGLSGELLAVNKHKCNETERNNIFVFHHIDFDSIIQIFPFSQIIFLLRVSYFVLWGQIPMNANVCRLALFGI